MLSELPSTDSALISQASWWQSILLAKTVGHGEAGLFYTLDEGDDRSPGEHEEKTRELGVPDVMRGCLSGALIKVALDRDLAGRNSIVCIYSALLLPRYINSSPELLLLTTSAAC